MSFGWWLLGEEKMRGFECQMFVFGWWFVVMIVGVVVV